MYDYPDAKREFEYFLETAQAAARRAIEETRTRPRLSVLRELNVEVTSQSSLQLWVGKRPTGRRTVSGAVNVEDGPYLVYSLGPMGHVATLLFPASSDLCRPHEEHIVLRLRRMTCFELRSSLRKDWNSFVPTIKLPDWMAGRR
jgi:hypothetical protein